MLLKTISISTERVWTSPGIENCAANLTFMVADLKLTPENKVKILEFGNGMRALLNGYTYCHNNNWLINQFWGHIFEDIFPDIDVPVFYDLQNKFKHNSRSFAAFQREYQLETLQAKGIIDNYSEIPAYQNKGFFVRKDSNFNKHNLFSYSGLLILDHRLDLDQNMRQKIQEEHPALLQLNSSADFDEIIMNKILTNALFCEEIKEFKPTWLIGDKLNDPRSITAEALENIESPYYVIKPIDACRGNGVNIVQPHALVSALTDIYDLYGSCATTGPLTTDERCGYQSLERFWSNDRHPYFLLEEHVRSKPVLVNTAAYDGTMRVVFSLEHSHDYMKMKFYDAYWKLPKQPLNGITIDNHNSISHVSGPTGSVAVDPQDIAVVVPQLFKVMEYIYPQLLQSDLFYVLRQLIKHHQSLDYARYLLNTHSA